MGFPVPGDAIEQSLDLNRHLIHNTAATFAMRVAADVQTNPDVQPGDLLLVDRSTPVQEQSLVVAIFNGELSVCRVQSYQHQWRPVCPDWNSDAEHPFEIWGVVTTIIRSP
jgi:DNA polymerase V